MAVWAVESSVALRSDGGHSVRWAITTADAGSASERAGLADAWSVHSGAAGSWRRGVDGAVRSGGADVASDVVCGIGNRSVACAVVAAVAVASWGGKTDVVAVRSGSAEDGGGRSSRAVRADWAFAGSGVGNGGVDEAVVASSADSRCFAAVGEAVVTGGAGEAGIARGSSVEGVEASGLASDCLGGSGGAEVAAGAEVARGVGERRSELAPVSAVANSRDGGLASSAAVVARWAEQAGGSIC